MSITPRIMYFHHRLFRIASKFSSPATEQRRSLFVFFLTTCFHLPVPNHQLTLEDWRLTQELQAAARAASRLVSLWLTDDREQSIPSHPIPSHSSFLWDTFVIYNFCSFIITYITRYIISTVLITTKRLINYEKSPGRCFSATICGNRHCRVACYLKPRAEHKPRIN